jgi:hypothetical protein
MTVPVPRLTGTAHVWQVVDSDDDERSNVNALDGNKI